MEMNNYLRVEEPEVYIKVGIKGVSVVKVDWGELIDRTLLFDTITNDKITEEVVGYLNQAIKMMKRKPIKGE
jgi:hypothetical protein